jgi:hypothetical protein
MGNQAPQWRLRLMEQHLDAADHVLCVVSDDYLKAPYSSLQRYAALRQKADPGANALCGRGNAREAIKAARNEGHVAMTALQPPAESIERLWSH